MSKQRKKGGPPAKGQRKPAGSGPGARAHGKGAFRAGAQAHVFLFGLHSVEAALKNPERDIVQLWGTRNGLQRLGDAAAARSVEPLVVAPHELDRLAGPDMVHQGVLLKTTPLPAPALEDIPDQGLCLALDQVTDPHNVGAILRSAAAFGVSAVVMTERNSPALSGVLAKAASGGMEHVPLVLVTNLSRALSLLGERGFTRIGLDGEGEEILDKSLKGSATVLVLGAEGKGLRRLTKEHCDHLCRIPTSGGLSSLNVSNAAAVALYALQAS